MPLTTPEILLTGVVVTLAGWLVVHRLSRSREREAREHADTTARAERTRHFESILVQWEQRIERTMDEQAIKSLYFGEAAALFRAEAAKIRGDFSDTKEFDRLDANLSRMSPQVLDADPTRTRREVIADAIRAFLRYIRKA